MSAPLPTLVPANRPAMSPLVVFLFAGSGCAALIYEIVWFQMLQLVIGSSAVSLGVLLGTFMGGMCLGSLCLARVVPARWHPLRVFGWIEAGVGICGLAVLLVAPWLARGYVALAGPGWAGICLRGVLGAVCLLPPTVLMGATLPAISRWVEMTPAGMSWLGFFYGGNLAGAVAGCLAAGFYLLRLHDLVTATGAAVAVNGMVAAFALWMASVTPRPEPADQPNPSAAADVATDWSILAAIGISGACALGAEVVWTRLLSLMLGGTVYTFSIILAVFLAGLGIGGGIGSIAGRVTRRPRAALGVCQWLLMGAIALAAHLLAKSLPYWPINPSLSQSPWFIFQLDLLRCAWAILPAACLWGASFPLALAAANPGTDPGRVVGRVYAANTLGAITGALACSLWLIPALGTQQIQRLLIGLSAAAGSLVFLPSQRGVEARDRRAGWNRLGLRTVWLLAAAGWAVVLAWGTPRLPWELVAHGRFLPTRTELGTNLFVGEGMNASVAVTEIAGGIRNFHVSGKVEASTDPQDMRLQRMLGHLPALLHPEPKSVLVVGCGAGVTAGSFTVYPGIERIVICEIEPLIPKVVARYFARENYGVVTNSRVKVVYDDARNYVLTTHEKFDIITSDPIHPWVKGAATLYTREYFEICRRHLNPGGLVTQWVPLYESNPEAVKSEIATFFEAFPGGTIWANEDNGGGYDLVLLGQEGPIQIDLGRVQKRLLRDDCQEAAQSLRDAGFKSAFSLLATYAGQASDLKPWLAGAQINRDTNLRLQYLAGMGLNLYQPDAIYTDMLFYRRFPAALFAGSDEWSRALKTAIERPRDGGSRSTGDR